MTRNKQFVLRFVTVSLHFLRIITRVKVLLTIVFRSSYGGFIQPSNTRIFLTSPYVSLTRS